MALLNINGKRRLGLPQITTGMYKVGGRSFNPNKLANLGDYNNICNYLELATDIRRHICRNCGASKIYDKNNKEYKISRSMTLQDAEFIVVEIRKLNAAE